MSNNPLDPADAPHGALFKTTIVIWSTYDGASVELEDLAREATVGDAYCSLQRSELVADPGADDFAPTKS